MKAAKTSVAPGAAPSDGAVLERIAVGDMSALGVLYDRYAAALLCFALRVAPSEAEDIVQLVFMRVVRLAATFDPSASSARPWLYAITARVAQEHKRAFRRWTRALMRIAEAPRAHGKIADARRDLDRGLASLSPEKRSVLVLAEVEGFLGEEIAAMLSIPIGTVWTRLHRARHDLRRYHEEEDR